MNEKPPSFTPYISEEPEVPSFTPERAARTAELTLERMEDFRQEFPRETLETSAGLLKYMQFHEAGLRRELDGRPRTSSEHMVAAAHYAQLGGAIDVFLRANHETLPPTHIATAERERNTVYAGAQQSIVSVLLNEQDPRSMRVANFLFNTIYTTPWDSSLREAAAKLGPERRSQYPDNVAGLLRGIGGHAAAVRLATTVFERPYRGYAPSADLDGKHGIDFALHDPTTRSPLIDIVAQAKGKVQLERGVVITPVAGDAADRVIALHLKGDLAQLSVAERRVAEHDIALGQLDRGTLRLREKVPQLVDSQRLIGLLIEVRAGAADQDWGTIKQSGEPAFDITTGLCNDSLLAAAEQEFLRIEPTLEEMRVRIKQQLGPARGVTRRPRPLRRSRLVH